MSNSRILNRQFLTIFSLIIGIIGFSLSIISFFLPYYVIKLTYVGGPFGPTIIFYPYGSYSFYSLLFGSIYGLLMTIILILFWKKKNSHTFLSLIVVGVLSLSLIVEYTILINKYHPSVPFISIYYIEYEHYLDSYYLNLIVIIFIISMIGFSVIGFFIFENIRNKNRRKQTGEIHTLFLYTILLLATIIILIITSKINYRYFSSIGHLELPLILVTIVLLFITILNPTDQYKSLIPSFLKIFFVMILTRLYLYFQDFRYGELLIQHFLFFEIILILLIFSFILFETIPRSLQKGIQKHRKTKKSKIIYFLKILNFSLVILLIYAFFKWFFYELNGVYWIISSSQEIIIFLLLLYPLSLFVVLSLIIYNYKVNKHNLIKTNLSLIVKIGKKKQSVLNNLTLFIVIFLFTIYFYLILCFYHFIPDDIKIIKISRAPFSESSLFLPDGFILFIFLNLIPLFIFLCIQILKLVSYRNRLSKIREIKKIDIT